MLQGASLGVSTKVQCMYQIFGPAHRQLQNFIQAFGPTTKPFVKYHPGVHTTVSLIYFTLYLQQGNIRGAKVPIADSPPAPPP